MLVITPRPAQPTPGSGPPDSTQRTPRYPARMTSSSSTSSTEPSSAAMDRTEVWALACSISRVESAFGSQPTIMMRLPCSAIAAMVFCWVVDLPMPPLP